MSVPPLAEQARIVAKVERRLSVVGGMEAVVNTNLQRATCLRQPFSSEHSAERLLATQQLLRSREIQEQLNSQHEPHAPC